MGDVVEVGKNITEAKVGDRVWVEAVEPSYQSEWCRQEGHIILDSTDMV
jgi:threonine dehydrogenase-like Zn-dependent dehydrogenase